MSRALSFFCWSLTAGKGSKGKSGSRQPVETPKPAPAPKSGSWLTPEEVQLNGNFGQNKGVVEVGANSVIDAFREKSDMDGNLINIGFMVFQPELFDLIEGDETVFEKGPLTKLVAQKQLVGYIHQGFWQCMDTKLEKDRLEEMWNSGRAPWKVWE